MKELVRTRETPQSPKFLAFLLGKRPGMEGKEICTVGTSQIKMCEMIGCPEPLRKEGQLMLKQLTLYLRITVWKEGQATA